MFLTKTISNNIQKYRPTMTNIIIPNSWIEILRILTNSFPNCRASINPLNPCNPLFVRIFPHLLLLFAAVSVSAQTNYDFSKLQTEKLNRGVVAFRCAPDSVAVSWRYLPTDPADVEFCVVRNGKETVAVVGAGQPTFVKDCLPAGKTATYEVAAVSGKTKIKEAKGKWTVAANAPVGYLELSLQRPDSIPNTIRGEAISYTRYVANDATAADLDGDGQMEIILKWDPTDSRDNSQSGLTSPTIIDAYRLDGQRLWRINLGRNIRSGAHYTQFLVADFNGDGRAELICRTSDCTIDGKGKVLGDASADHRRQLDNQVYQANGNPREQFRGPAWPKEIDRKSRKGGFIYKGPEWLTVFDGKTGRAISTVDYLPARGEIGGWGDNYANRSDRFLAATAYLDGKHLSAVFCRGYYTRTGIAAYDFDGKKLTLRWLFDTNGSLLPSAANPSTLEQVLPSTPQKDGKTLASYAGQGNHNLRVADVDGDGCDEITYGSMAVDNDGIGLYNTGFGHGDAMHLTSFSLGAPLSVWDCHENKRDGSELRDARTGKVIFQILSPSDVGRCMAADISASNPGLEMWSSASGGICDIRGEVIDSTARVPINFGIWWDGDLLRELLDHETVSKYVGARNCTPLMKMEGCAFNNGSKSNPSLCADILGDWREEVVVRTADSRSLRIYISPIPTRYRFHTFLADPVYRHSVTMQNIGYNQPTNVGFYFGAELEGSGLLFRGWQF